MTDGREKASGNDRNGAPQHHEEPPATERAFREAAAGDLALLARLHARELTIRDIEEIRKGSFADLLALLPESEEAAQAVAVIDRGWQVLPQEAERLAEELAADYAATYLTFRNRVPVTESVCLDKDNLERQEPMRQVRAWYRRFGVAAPDWRKMADDHIALQLAFVSHLLMSGPRQEDDDARAKSGPASLSEAAAFLDAHLLRWVDDFARAAASRCATPFYAGLAMLTRAWLVAFRQALDALMPPAAEVTATPARETEERQAARSATC